MTSARQILAAQTNGRKSRGPKTHEGRRRSSGNSLKHGLYAKHIPFDAECAEDFQTRLADYTAECRPTDDYEASLVTNLASAEARELWAIRAASRLIDRACEDLPLDTDPDIKAGLACSRIWRLLGILDVMERRFANNASQAGKQLRKYRERTGFPRQKKRKLNKINTDRKKCTDTGTASLRTANPFGRGNPGCDRNSFQLIKEVKYSEACERI
jgi:hypothetical protein